MLTFTNCSIRRINMAPTQAKGECKLPANLGLESTFTPNLARDLHCHDNFYERNGEWLGNINNSDVLFSLPAVSLSLTQPEVKERPPLELSPVTLTGFRVGDKEDGPKLSFSAVIADKDVLPFMNWLFANGKFYQGVVQAKVLQEPLFEPPKDATQKMRTASRDGAKPRKRPAYRNGVRDRFVELPNASTLVM